ncbi:DMT family transporter [Sphingomonas oligoaromativorans]|uniref:DMT family transporter n=1 Tax=Sphingomonas oligoaromativorans TaxID=575322 RepID=UPI00141F4D7C|nr:DMT family transporter [Sphingomonas oligoaromativorans]NIJ34924.1 drug/metabolite transporter (DMT)-like permease [Sphingomonas oligoaromativorans]
MKSRLPDLALWAVAFVWGGTFLATRIALGAGSGPFFFVGLRFGTAALATVLLLRGRLRGTTRRDIVAAIAIGIPMAAGYLLQTGGLQSVSSSMSAFLTALYVPLVPLIQWAVLRRAPQVMSWIGILLAFAGLVLIANPSGGSFGFGRGEWMTLASAIAFSGEIILIGRYAESIDAGRVAVLDLMIVAVAGFIAMPFAGESFHMPGSAVWISGIGLGIASAFIQLAMNWAQRTVSPTRATLIYSSEPVFAGILGRFAGERLGMMGWAGAALILCGVVVGELKPRRWHARN